MAVLHEGGDPQEFQELNGQKLEELKKQKKSQHSDILSYVLLLP